jgi:hypothetical protein
MKDPAAGLFHWVVGRGALYGFGRHLAIAEVRSKEKHVRFPIEAFPSAHRVLTPAIPRGMYDRAHIREKRRMGSYDPEAGGLDAAISGKGIGLMPLEIWSSHGRGGGGDRKC